MYSNDDDEDEDEQKQQQPPRQTTTKNVLFCVEEMGDEYWSFIVCACLLASQPACLSVYSAVITVSEWWPDAKRVGDNSNGIYSKRFKFSISMLRFIS